MKALVDGPTTGVKRQALSFRRLQLTDYKIAVPRTAGSVALKKALEKANFSGIWEKSAWARKQQIRSKRSQMTDFDRHKLRLAKKLKSKIVSEEIKNVKA